MAFLALMLGSLLLQLETLSARGRWLVPAGALGLSVVMLLAGALTSGYNNAQPRPKAQMELVAADVRRLADSDLSSHRSGRLAETSEALAFRQCINGERCQPVLAFIMSASDLGQGGVEVGLGGVQK